MTTVFGTAGRNYAADHRAELSRQLVQSVGGNRQLAGEISARLQAAGSNGLQPADIQHFVAGLPASERPAALRFFAGPYREFSHQLLAHASGQGFLAGVAFGLVAVLAAVFLINVSKKDVPAEPTEAVA